MSCPLKKSWKLRRGRARKVVAHLGGAAVFATVSSVVAEFGASGTLLELFHIFELTARDDGQTLGTCGGNPEGIFGPLSVCCCATAAYCAGRFPQFGNVSNLELPRGFDPR